MSVRTVRYDPEDIAPGEPCPACGDSLVAPVSVVWAANCCHCGWGFLAAARGATRPEPEETRDA